MNSEHPEQRSARPGPGIDDPHEPFQILFVCTANICRSPMAQQLLLMVLGNGADAARFRVTSAGTHAYDGLDMEPHAAEELRRLGGDPVDFRSRCLTDRACEEADLILTATREQRSTVLERVPRALRRTFTMLEFSQSVTASLSLPAAGRLPSALVAHVAAERGNNRFSLTDVTDPYGGTVLDHRLAADSIFGAVTVIGAQLISGVQHVNSAASAND